MPSKGSCGFVDLPKSNHLEHDYRWGAWAELSALLFLAQNFEKQNHTAVYIHVQEEWNQQTQDYRHGQEVLSLISAPPLGYLLLFWDLCHSISTFGGYLTIIYPHPHLYSKTPFLFARVYLARSGPNLGQSHFWKFGIKTVSPHGKIYNSNAGAAKLYNVD